MKKQALCFGSLILYILIACTIVSGWIEATMMTQVEQGPVNTKAAHEAVTRELPPRSLFADQEGLHLYEIYDGTGWESGKRIREVSGWSLTGECVSISGFPDTAYVFSATRQPKAGEQVLVLEKPDRGDDVYLALFKDGVPGELELPTEAASSTRSSNALVLEMKNYTIPFMEHRAKSVSPTLEKADRIFSIGDVRQFFGQLPAIGALAGLLTAGLALLLSALVLWKRRHGPALVNLCLSGLCLCLTAVLLQKTTLPASLLPRENILELSYYRKEFAVLTSGLSGFPELSETLSAAGAAARTRGLLYFGLSVGLFPLLLLAENLPVRRNA